MRLEFRRGGRELEKWLKQPWNRSFLRMKRIVAVNPSAIYPQGVRVAFVGWLLNRGTKYMRPRPWLDHARAEYRRRAPAFVERTLRSKPNITPKALDAALRKFGKGIARAAIRRFKLVRTGRLLGSVGVFRTEWTP